MNMADCIQTAVNAGTVDPERARLAQAEYADLVARYEMSGYSRADAEVAAGDEVLESITKRAKARRHATVRQMMTMARNEARYANAHAKDPDLILKDVEHAEKEARALERQFMGGIREFLETFRTNVIGQVRERAMLKQVVSELHGEATGNANAKAIAGAVLQQYERARALINMNGGDIGKLDDFGVPHSHHGDKIRDAGFGAWFDEIYGALDWHRMIDFSTGKPFVVAKGAKPLRPTAEKFLREVYDSITTSGWTDRSPAMTLGVRGLKDARSAHRVLHFKSAEDWWRYNDAFGRENAFEAVIGHLRGMARDIALMRAFGPNPKLGLEHAAQVMTRDAKLVTGPAGRKASDKIDRKARRARVMMKILSGEANVPHNKAMAAFLAGTRNLLTAAQLGGAPLSQVTDLVSMRIAAKAVGMNPNAPVKALFNGILGGINSRAAKDMGFILDTWFDTGASQARFMGDIWSPELTNRITNTVLRLNGLAFLTDRSRTGVAMAFGSDLADRAGRGWADLEPELRRFMENRNITAQDWDALRDPAVIYTDPTGGKHLNPAWFLEHTSLPRGAAEDLAIRFGALVQEHVEFSIPSASLRGRAAIVGDAAPGSIGGELLRSTVMYKSYVMSVMFNQFRRVAEIDGFGNRAAYVTKYVALMTLMGGLAVQLKEVAKGRDPRPMDDARFWGAALLQGGGIGIFGDFFGSSTSRAGGGFAETAAGPVVGVAGDLMRAVISNVVRASEGKDILIGRDVVNILRRYNPLATFQPLVPVPIRLALDRMIWDQLQPFFDPEAEDLWRQAEGKLQSWWKRGSIRPTRGPDLSNAFGGDQ